MIIDAHSHVHDPVADQEPRRGDGHDQPADPAFPVVGSARKGCVLPAQAIQERKDGDRFEHEKEQEQLHVDYEVTRVRCGERRGGNAPYRAPHSPQ